MTLPATSRPDEAIATPIAEIPLSPRLGWRWLAALVLSGGLLLVLFWGTGELFLLGVGVWGVNIPYVWGFDLINYAWWISIANAASLIAVILVLRRHSLRTAVNRFAEGAALFAVICAGLFPILHLGRPELFYWVFPYPATFQVWPQFRSPLIWDFWSITTHMIVTTVFWYVGMIPDLATLRDRATARRAQLAYGLLSLGWRGSAWQWHNHQIAYRFLAALIVPLILIMQSVVAWEFSVTLVPDWHQTRFPMHFVVTALVSGLATVLALALVLRRSLRIEAFITAWDISVMAKLLLASSLVLAYSYADEAFLALLGDPYARASYLGRATGEFAAIYWGAILCAVGAAQLLWLRTVREGFWAPLAIAIVVNVGIWLDRFAIVVAGLYRDYLPSIWRTYAPTMAEWMLLIGTIGLFCVLLLLFVRFLPVITMFETRHAEREETE
jgi:molybdopterin-containing oxidoreductase family membrane subunit